MSRLTLRIFLGFFGSLLLLGAASIAITTWWARSQNLQLEKMQQLEAEAAALALAEGGTGGLREWAQRQASRRDGGPIFLVVDDWGEDLLGRVVPAPEPLEGPLIEGADWPMVTLALPPPLPVLVSEDEERFQLVAVSPSADKLTLTALARTAGPQLLLAGIVLLLVSVWIARSITRPLLQLERTADRLAAGELETRAPSSITSRTDELGTLARSFDRMATRLERLLLNRERLLQDISHELRSPLSRLRLSIGLLRQAGEAPAQIERMEVEVGKLDHLLGQVLDVARLDSGKEWLRRESLDLVQVLAPLIEDARFEAAARECSVIWMPPAAVLPIVGDADWTAAAIENVLRNALRHTPTRSSVRVEARAHAQFVELLVRDEGPGVPEAELEKIFEPFHRVDGARSAQEGGAGLGLAIAARVLRAQGGTIEARTRDGLEVTLRWPRRNA